MKKVLVFPNSAKMVEYLLAWKKFNLSVDFSKITLTGELTETETEIACSKYGAVELGKKQSE